MAGSMRASSLVGGCVFTVDLPPQPVPAVAVVQSEAPPGTSRGNVRDLRTLGVRVNLDVAESHSASVPPGSKSERAATCDEQIEERTDGQTH
jgi:hypothetical protein